MTDTHDPALLRLPAIILAAGLSTRMKDFKPLMTLGGQMLIHQVITSLHDSTAIGDIIVVTGHRAADVETAVRHLKNVRVTFNPQFAQGEMLSSVKAGIAALPIHNPPAGFVLAFADQPAVLSATIRTLVTAFSAQRPPLAIPTFQGKRGHPVAFSHDLAPEIQALSATDTLRTLVHRHLPAALLVEVPDPSILEDLDTPEDFARAQARRLESGK